ncbi:MAG: SDR family oxidoreductase [Parasporobacterium sp.]|nr:SDR family oxidoreductase [Parasporobacterium sp.]
MKKYALITGASRGIGKAVACALARRGFSLILTASKDSTSLEETSSIVSQIYKDTFPGDSLSLYNVHTFLFDLGDSTAIDRFFEELDAAGIRENIDVLVNNAGIDLFELVQDTTMEQWRRIMSVNADSVFYMSKKVLPAMLHRHDGVIINISSYWGIAGAAMESAYCASKGAVNAFTLSLASELEPSGISVNALACEFIDTDMNSHLNKEEIEDALKLMPSGRVISPEEIGEACAALAAERRNVTGKILSMSDIL